MKNRNVRPEPRFEPAFEAAPRRLDASREVRTALALVVLLCLATFSVAATAGVLASGHADRVGSAFAG